MLDVFVVGVGVVDVVVVFDLLDVIGWLFVECGG